MRAGAESGVPTPLGQEALGPPVRSLFVVCRWPDAPEPGAAGQGGRATRAVRAALDLVGRSALRGHREVHVRHFANPRPPDYLLALAARAARTFPCQGAPDLWIEDDPAPQHAGARTEEATTGVDTSVFGRVDRRALRGSDALEALRREALAYGRVVLFVPDALGLGQEALEEALLADPAARVFVVNGRRRVEAISPAVRRRLRWRRFLARTRVVEALLAAVIVPFAFVLAVRDR